MSIFPTAEGGDAMDDLLIRYGSPPQRVDVVKQILMQAGITTKDVLKDAIELLASPFGTGIPPNFSGDDRSLEETAAALEAMKTMFRSHEVEPYNEQE